MMLADAVDRDRLVTTLLELIAIDSPTGHEEKIGRELSGRLRELGCQVSQDDIGNLIAVLPGNRPDTVLVSTHMDTVGSDTGIQPIIDNGVIRTDGSTILGADNKSGIAGCLEFLRLLNANPDMAHPTIEFVITVGEERGLVGSRQPDVGALHASYGFVFDTPVIGSIGRRLRWTSRSLCMAKRAHAGVEPEKGIDAVRVAAEAISAEGGTTDSFEPTLQLLHDGLAMIKGSYCPHYDAEDQRRPLFHSALLDGSLEMGYASWNRVAIRFSADGEVVEAVTSEQDGRALEVYARDGEIVEEDIPCRFLEERVWSRSVST